MTDGSFTIPVPRAEGLPLPVQAPPPDDPGGGAIEFPRVWAVAIGSRVYAENNADGERQRDHLSRFNGITLGMFSGGPWDSANPTSHLSRSDIVADFKARNPDIVLTDYTNVMEAGLGGRSSGKLYGEVGPNGICDWWAYRDVDLGCGDANKFQTFPGPYNTNLTDFVTPDSQGRRYPQYYGDRIITELLAPVALGVGRQGINIYIDVADIRPRTNSTDYNGDGTSDNARRFYDDNTPSHVNADQNYTAAQKALGRSIAAAWRLGARRYTERVRDTYPDCIVICNIVTWPRETNQIPKQFILPPELIGWCQGGQIEGQSVLGDADTGFPFSGVLADGTPKPASTFGTWIRAYAMYVSMMDDIEEPKLVNNDFHIELTPEIGISLETGTDESLEGRLIRNFEPTGGPWHLYRWGLCTTLLHNGYFQNTVRRGYSQSILGDETGLRNTSVTGLRKGFLGLPIDAPQLSARFGNQPHQMWWREFDNGWAIVNTSHTNTLTFPISAVGGAGQVRRIEGVYDPSWNNGQPQNTDLSIPPIDGIILLKLSAFP